MSNFSYLNFAVFSLLGISNLIGWNVVLTSLDVFANNFEGFDVYFLMVIPCDFGSLLANFLIGVFIKHFSVNQRIVSSLLLLSISIILLPVEAYVLPNAAGFWIFMVLNFAISVFMVFLQGSILGLAGNINDFCMSSINFGFSVSGVLCCFLRIICLISWKNSSETNFYSVLIYYLSSTAIVILTLFVFLRFQNEETKKKKALLEKLETEIAAESIQEDAENSKEDESGKKIYSFMIKSIWECWPFSGLMFLMNVQTFLLFPGMALGKRIFGLEEAWNGAVLLLVFNVFDAIGRYTSLLRIFYGKIGLTICTFLRFVFVATFYIIFKGINIAAINNGYFAIGNMIVFAFSNGYIVTALFIIAAEKYARNREKELASFMMSFMMNIGGIVGSLAALKFASLS